MNNHKNYQKSDCTIMNGCKEYFYGTKHIEVCDRFAKFLCDQINDNNKYATKIIEALDKEELIITYIFKQAHWGNIFHYIYSNTRYCLSLIDDGEIEKAMGVFFMWHNIMCKIVN